LQKKSKSFPNAGTALDTKVVYQFQGFRLDPGQHLLLHEGKPVALTPKAFELLTLLLQHNGRLLTKDELMRRLWPDSFVEEANLTVNVSALRKALGDGHDGQQFIETVPKHGYRFSAAVTEVGKESEAARPSKVAVLQPIGGPVGLGAEVSAIKPARLAATSRSRVMVIVFLILGIALAGVVAYRQRPARRQPLEPRRRLAILPFQNLRRDPDSDFLGYSLADAVITKLGYVQALRVRPSYAIAKYRNQTIEIPKVAAELNVDTLLMGNFIRDGDDLRITCQLVDAATDNILWNGAFDLKYDKLLSVHDNVAQEIIKGLELNLSPSEAERLKPDQPIDPLAYEYYLRGVDLYARDMFPVAVKMLEKSAEIEPSYPLTWAYLGRSYNASASFEFGGREHYRKAQAAFEKALTLQPALIDARVYLANFFTDTGRAEQAVPLLREALKTNPDRAEVHWELGYAYRFGGMLTESVAECGRARELDPLVKLNNSALNAYLYLGRYDEFLQSLSKTSDTAFIVFYRGFGEYHKKDWDAAARNFDRAFELNPSLLQAQVGKALSYAIAKQGAKGLQILHEAEDKIKERDVRDSEAIYKIAQAYSVLGDRASSIRVLRYSIEHGFFAYPYFTADPLLSSLRHEPEFERLMKMAEERHQAFKKAFF
jgi:DNA-binding winged helix-turn-helix (wHTH) protein/TolB-like protein